MRILHAIAAIDPAHGGPPVVALCLAAAQASLGHSVHLAYYTIPGSQERIEQTLARLPNAKLIQHHPIPAPGVVQLALGQSARKRVEALLGEIDFMHLHGMWQPMLPAVARAAFARGVPYAITPHGMLDPWSLSQKRIKKKLAMMLGWRGMIKRSAFVHALNRDEARLIEPQGFGCPMEVIANGVFLEEIDPLPPRGAFHARHPELDGRPFILFLSRLHYKKGLDYLADAFAIIAGKHPEYRLVVVGPDGGARADFEARIAAAGLTRRTHVIGPVYGAERFTALVDCACFCLPSRQEGFSMAVVEAMATKTPVVISEAVHFPEVREAGAGLVVELDAAKVARAIEEVCEPAVGGRMGEAGRALVESRYTWGRIAEQMIGAYERHRSIPSPGTPGGRHPSVPSPGTPGEG